VIKAEPRFGTKAKHVPAVRCTPLTLRKSVSPRRNTYLALEVSDGQRTLCVVRGKVVLEKH
jgi:hypothetical protein